LVLDSLLEQTAPTRPLEAMLGGGLCEVPFLEPLSALPIAARRRSVGLSAGALEQIMPRVTIETAACFGTGALVGEATAGADSRARPIVKVTAVPIEVVPVKQATGRTLISVTSLIILKAGRRIDILLLGVAHTAAQVAHMGADALARQSNEVFGRAIFAVGHHRAWSAGGMGLMLREQAA